MALGCDIASFQGFEDELQSLPGKYSRQRGGELYAAVACAGSTAPAFDGAATVKELDGVVPTTDSSEFKVVGSIAFKQRVSVGSTYEET